MKAEILEHLLHLIESHKKLLSTFKVVLDEDRLNGMNMFCFLNHKVIYDMNKQIEQITVEYIRLIDPVIKDKTLTIR